MSLSLPDSRSSLPDSRSLSRRRLLGYTALGVGGLAAATLTGCAVDTSRPSPADTNSLADPDWSIPDTVPAGTVLAIGDPSTQVALTLSGLDKKLGFEVKWANLSGGPQTSEAFRAKALDLGSVADIPGINAHWTGLATKFVAALYRADPLRNPLYELGIAPGAGITDLAGLRGKRIAFSPSQAQGALVVRILAKAGLTRKDVTLVEIPSTGEVYPQALASKQVDAAPLGGTNVKRYLQQYAKDGASIVHHGLRDDPDHLYAPAEVVQDKAKAAAIAQYVKVWGEAKRWIYDHPQEWVQGYYVANQRLSAEDGRYLVDTTGRFEVPGDWGPGIDRTQQTIDLLADFLGRDRFDANLLFDKRFAGIAAPAFTGKGAPA